MCSKHALLQIFLLLQLVLVSSISSFAQVWENNLFFKTINNEDGLSNPTVNCIYQDSRGFIWIGTVGGLNKYDGYEFKVFQSNPSDTNSLPSNRINALYEDSEENLWIATAAGLCRYNYRNELFTTFSSGNVLDQVYEIAPDETNNRLWVVTSNGGVSYLDVFSGKVERFDHNLITNSGDYKLQIIDQNLFIGTRNNGLLKLDLESFELEEFCNTKNGHFQIKSNRINSLHDFNGELCIGTDEELVKYNFKSRKPTFFHQTNTLPFTSILSMDHDSRGDLYLATDYGLAILDIETGSIISYKKKPGHPSTLSSNRLRSVFVDKKDNVWIGTIQKGVVYLNRKSRDMVLVVKEFDTRNTLSDNNMACFAQDEKGGLWIGTNETGLNYYINGQYQHFAGDESKYQFNNNNVTDICIGADGTVWVSAYNGGLYAYKNGMFKQFMVDKSDPNALHANNVRDIEIGKIGIIWLATDEGLESYDMEKGVFSHHYLERGSQIGSKRKNIRCIIENIDGDIFAGTNTGLYIYHPGSGNTDHYLANPNDSNALSDNTILDLFEDSKGRIWLGTRGGGLIRFHKQGNTFTNYMQKDGFPDNAIKSIEEDSQGNLWMGSNNGIIRFSPESGQVATFGNSYGLQNKSFSTKASLKLNDGRLIFGGPDGFNVLNPDKLEPEGNRLEIVFTDLKLFDQSIRVSDKTNVLQENISLVQTLHLSYQQSKHFTLSFSALEYFSSGQIQYAYKLEGFDDNWNYINKVHHVSFTNLPPADYVLKVMASDNGKWDNPISQLRISIPAPWYMTTWFKVAVILLFGSLIVSVYFYRIYNFKKRQRILEKLVAEQNKEITTQNQELQAVNEELVSQNEEMVVQRDYIDKQNIQLTKVQDELKIANHSLEERIKIRTSELEESNKTLDKAVKELDRFVYSASHDLSAPLKSILGLVNIAKLEDKDKNLQVHLDYIENSIIKQEDVIKSLTQYSRNARQDIKLEPVNIYSTVNQIISDLRYLPHFENIEIINKIPEGETILTDEQRLKMIVNNLLNNGIKYHDHEKPNSFIKIEIENGPISWKLIVEDNGLGIEKSQKKNIFHMFHRATEASEGSGLGLFIVQEAVERLGGKISVESELSEGAVFTVYLPK